MTLKPMSIVLLAGLVACTPKPGPTPPPPPPPTGECACVVPVAGWKAASVSEQGMERFYADLLATAAGKDLAGTLAYLEQQNVCAGAVDGDVMLARPDGIWERWALDGAYRGVWTNSGAAICKGGVR